MDEATPKPDPCPAGPTADAAGSAAQSAEPASKPLRPVRRSERIEILDVLRGFAILGILLVNMALFFSPMSLQMILRESLWNDSLSQAIELGIVFFAQGKFYSLFSFLFGIGLAIQMQRAEARGREVTGFFARRMGWLLLIGLVHGLLIWFGDILALYSLMGLLLLAFRQRAYRTLKIWIAVFFALPLLLAGAQVFVTAIFSQMEAGAEMIEAQISGQREVMREMASEALRVYPDGSWLEINAVRFKEWLMVTPVSLIFFGWIVLAIFLIGLYAGRKRFFSEFDRYLPAVRRWFWIMLPVGILANLGLVWTAEVAEPMTPDLWHLVNQVLFILAPPTLTAAYVLGTCLLWQRPGVRRALLRVAPVGRMALTNYLMHSVVFTLVSYGYGLGYYGRVSPALGLVLTFAIFAVQIVLSAWWLGRFRFGPVEWLWRSLTYGKVQPMRRQPG